MKYVNNLIEKRAIKVYQTKPFAHEYGVFIAVVLIVKLALSIFNGYAAYYLYKNYLTSEFNNEIAAMSMTVFAILALEFLVNYTLMAFFKASFRGNLKWAAGLLILSFFFFSISFLSSTNGLAQRQAHKADNTSIILDKYNVQASELKKNAENEKSLILAAIETIKSNPSGWRSGHRDVLQPEQLQDIKSNYDKIQETNNNLKNEIDLLEQKKAQELKQNNGNVIVVENRFYKTAIYLMALQLVINGIITFFYSRIFGSKHMDKIAQDHVNNFADKVSHYTTELIESNIGNIYHNYMLALDNKLNDNNKDKGNDKKNDPDKKIGFRKDQSNLVISNNDRVITDDNKTNMRNITNEIRICKYCGKEFSPYNIKHVFCSTDCKKNWHKENKGFDLDKFLRRK